MRYLNRINKLRNFLMLWSSQSISSLGTAMTNYSLIIWTFKQQGTVTSITLLSFCTYLPSILFCFVAGTLADRWDKKKIMLFSDLVAAGGTLTVFLLYSAGQLRIHHLYVVNFILSFMNAFQCPASYVVETLLTPEEYYVKTSGLHSLSNSLVTLLSPALATAVLSFGGIKTVFTIDLITFVVAFSVLLFFIKVPEIKSVKADNSDNIYNKEPFFKSCMSGLNFLKEHKPIWRIILFFSFINLLASMAGNSLMPALILARTGNNEVVLGMVSSGIGIGTLVGSILVTISKPAKSRTRVIFLSCAVSFLLCDLFWAVGRNTAVWVFASLAGNLPLPFLNANLTNIMRTKVPVEMQGRVFSTRDTFQYITIPVGFLLGGFLSDYIFEPFMAGDSVVKIILAHIVGSGKGSGMAVIFLITAIVGFLSSMLCLKDSLYRELDT